MIWTQLGLAAPLLASCAALPKQGVVPAMRPASAFASTASLAAPETSWPSDHWWEGFGDPQLTALIGEGLSDATDLRVAQARFERAGALVREARSRLLPSLQANGEIGGTKQSYNYLIPRAIAPQGWKDYGQATMRLDWELDFWGRNRAALGAARSDAAAAQAEAAAARLVISSGIAEAYADLADLFAQADAARRAVEIRRRTVELMDGRRAQGLENAGAVERARSALASSQGELAALNETVSLTRNRIAVLLGAGPDRGLSIDRPTARAVETFGLPANLPADLIGRRPDVIAARLRAQAAASRIKEARAAFYPNVNLAGLIGLQSIGIGDLVKSGSTFGTVGPAISLPIFDGGRLTGAYRAAEADYRGAVAEYDGALAQALREVADAAASERALTERIARADEAERAATAAWTVADNRYRGGLATSLDVLVAEDALIDTRRNLATLRNRRFVLDVALIRALGGGFRS
ncbi:efflux transporter outer membrane subunit [Novosphingobium sp. Leaf2]|uniref:efflux transporter outer membrane subunit n=1 Tax=Novosphingobium sp. Leaf2 TaxID=1735670 RepID=UPI001F3C4877|nr:efflux transporter outer membrane subunit [Novosphingobium sp. Leaf2]